MTDRLLWADDHSVLRDGLAALLGVQDCMTVVAHAQNGRETVRKATDLNHGRCDAGTEAGSKPPVMPGGAI